MTNRSPRRLPILVGTAVAVTAGLAVTQPTIGHAASNTSSKVAYVTDFNGGSNGGYNLFTDAMGLSSAPGGGTVNGSGSYSTASPASALTVTVTNLDTSTLGGSTTSLSAYDTAVLYEACNIGSDPSFLKAVNNFVDGGGKLMIMDGAQCVDGAGGNADYSHFEQPFHDNYKDPDPHDPQGTAVAPLGYTYTEPESGPAQTLTNLQPDCGTAPCNEPGNPVTDGSVINPTNPTSWCESLGATDTNGVSGAMEAYTHSTKAGDATPGLVVYEGEAYAATNNNTTAHPTFAAVAKHLRLLFDSFLTQPANPDTLPCSNPLQPAVGVPETPLTVIFPLISFALLSAFVIPAVVRRRRRLAA